MDRLGFGYDDLKELRPDIVYVSNSGFGHSGPYGTFRSWGPIVQAVGGLTLHLRPPRPAAGRLGLLVHGPHRRLHHGHRPARRALPPAPHRRGPVGRHGLHRGGGHAQRSGRCWTTRSTVGRCARDGSPNSNRHNFPAMAPHGIYPTDEDDRWVADRLPRRRRLGRARGAARRARRADRWADRRRARRLGRLPAWTRTAAPASRSSPRCRRGACRSPRCCCRPSGATTTSAPPRGACGRRSSTPSTARSASTGCRCTCRARTGSVERGGPLLGEDNDRVFSEVLGLTPAEIDSLARRGGHLMGPLDGLQVVELPATRCAPGPASCWPTSAPTWSSSSRPAGAPQRTYEPFLDDVPGPERSLWWWHYNTSKRSVVVDRSSDGRPRAAHLAGARCRRGPRRRAARSPTRSPPTSVSITRVDPRPRRRRRPHPAGRGRSGVEVRLRRPHASPPVRGGGNQGLAHRVALGGDLDARRRCWSARSPAQGQHIDVDAARRGQRHHRDRHATAGWPASRSPSARPVATPARCRACRPSCRAPTVVTSTPGSSPASRPSTPRSSTWLERHRPARRLRADRRSWRWAPTGIEVNSRTLREDPVVAAGGDVGARGPGVRRPSGSTPTTTSSAPSAGASPRASSTPPTTCSTTRTSSPVAGPTEVEHPELGRTFTYAGAPYLFHGTPWQIRSSRPATRRTPGRARRRLHRRSAHRSRLQTSRSPRGPQRRRATTWLCRAARTPRADDSHVSVRARVSAAAASGGAALVVEQDVGHTCRRGGRAGRGRR